MTARQLHLGLTILPAVPEAGPDMLPGVLVAPPWRRPRPAPLPPLPSPLTVPDTTAQVVWESDEHLRYLRPPSTGSPWHQQQLEQALQRGSGASPWHLRHLDDTTALQVWNDTPATVWEHLLREDLLYILARFGTAALPGLRAFARVDLVTATEALSHVLSPTVAPLMAKALASRSGRALARRWFLRAPQCAAVGLIPTALRDQRTRRPALAALRLLQARGHSALIQRTAARYGPAASTWIAAWLARDPLLDVPSRRPKMPDFWSAERLPRPLLTRPRCRLPLRAVEHLGELLCFTPIAPAYAGLAAVREVCCPRSMDDFAWGLFCAWEEAGSPPQHDWAMWVLGHLGGDRSARKLAHRIRSWPGQGASLRSRNGLQILVMIGTPVARLHLHHIAETTRYPALRQAAWEALEELAALQGMPTESLLDQPSWLGLDEQGCRRIDFGRRWFTVSFGADLEPRVQDQQGRSLRALPRPARRDVAHLAEQAHQDWRDLRADVRILSTVWSRRMERLMCSGGRWELPAFQQLLSHPLLSHTAARLIWAAYAPTGQRLLCFRIAEDWTLADEDDEQIQLPADALIGLPHRLELGAAEAQGWLELLSAYEIAQPFPQLGRRIYRPTPTEEGAAQLLRFVGMQAPAGRVLGLQSRGWQWGEPVEERFSMCTHLLPGLPFRAELILQPGIQLHTPTDQRLGALCIQRLNSWHEADRLPLGQLDPVQFSELLRDIDALTAG